VEFVSYYRPGVINGIGWVKLDISWHPFEAVIVHITDLDLPEPEEDVDDRYLSFSSQPLTEVS